MCIYAYSTMWVAQRHTHLSRYCTKLKRKVRIKQLNARHGVHHVIVTAPHFYNMH